MPRPTAISAGGPICVSVMLVVPDDADVNERAAEPPGVNWPANVSVTGEVVVGEVAVEALSHDAAKRAASPKAANMGHRRVKGA